MRIGKMKDMTIEEFAEQTAAGTPAPGGGSVSALGGAMAAALTQMVASLTLGRKKYVDVQEDMEKVGPAMEPLRVSLLNGIREDSEAFDCYMKALALPKQTPAQQEERRQAMEEGLKQAVLVPLESARKSLQILPYAKTVVMEGNRTALTDGLVAALMARSAVLGAVANVKINLKSISDEAFVKEKYKEADRIQKQALELESEIRRYAEALLN